VEPSGLSNSGANSRPPRVLFPGQPTPTLYDCVKEAVRTRHHGRRTEGAYLDWIRHFLAFHNGSHTREMVEMGVNRFPSHLAVAAIVAAATLNQALAAVLFLTNTCWDGPWTVSKKSCGPESRSGCRSC
jgi:hypothetical protein